MVSVWTSHIVRVLFLDVFLQSVVVFFSIYSWRQDYFSLANKKSQTSTTAIFVPKHFFMRHNDLLTNNSLVPTTHDLQMALCLYFTHRPSRNTLQLKKKRSCTESLAEWADFLRARVTWRQLDLAVNNACGGFGWSMWCTPALPTNSVRYHRLSPRTACRVESSTATCSFFNEGNLNVWVRMHVWQPQVNTEACRLKKERKCF